MLLCNLITEFILMKVNNMMIQARDVLLNSAQATVDYTLVVSYHAHCSIAYVYGLFANTGGIVISCDSGVLKC